MARRGGIENLVHELTAHKEGQKWLPLIASLGGVSAGFILYEQHRRSLGPDDMFPGFSETIRQLLEANKDPRFFFYPLPDKRIRVQAAIPILKRIGDERPVRYIDPPLTNACEWTLGKLHFQEAQVEIADTPSLTGAPERVLLRALVGDHYALHKSNDAYDTFEARVDIERILSKYPAGVRALEAKYGSAHS